MKTNQQLLQNQPLKKGKQVTAAKINANQLEPVGTVVSASGVTRSLSPFKKARVAHN